MHGERAQHYNVSQWGAKYSILPAISLDGILHLEVVENTVTGDNFHHFVEGLLPHMNMWPLPLSVLVVDNASIHKVAGIRDMVKAHGVHLVYLPSYSPDLNPIELAFSIIKSWLHANCDHVNMELESENGCVYNLFWEAVHLVVTVEHAKG